MDQKAIIVRFNDYINSRDLNGLSKLMTDDHTLVTNSILQGKGKVLEAWREFFKLLPDYKNTFNIIELQDDFVRVIGHSTCSDKRLDGPALWMVKVQGNKIAEWRVYDDTPENRELIGIKQQSKN